MKDRDTFCAVGIHMSALSFQGAFEAVVGSIVAAYHAQACYAAMRRVVLKVYLKVFHLYIIIAENKII